MTHRCNGCNALITRASLHGAERSFELTFPGLGNVGITDGVAHYKKDGDFIAHIDCKSVQVTRALALAFWYAGKAKGVQKATFGLSTCARMIGVDEDSALKMMPAIADYIDDAFWSNGKLQIQYGAPKSAPRAIINEVFGYWAEKLHPKAKLGKARERVIAGRLAEGFTVDELKRAIDGIASSDWHKKEGHTDLTLILRDEAHVEKYAGRRVQRTRNETLSERMSRMAGG